MARDPKETTKRESVHQDASKEAQLKHRRESRGTGELADWRTSDAIKLREAIGNVTKHGYAILIGYTRQQGAYTIRIVGLEGVDPDYIRPNEDIDLYLEGLALDFE
jgi:anti-sigma regulatory factor (Ser/Thr protein kinase)